VLGAEEFENAITTPVGADVAACHRARARVGWSRARCPAGRSAVPAAQPEVVDKHGENPGPGVRESRRGETALRAPTRKPVGGTR
jgi:hypothetical protein